MRATRCFANPMSTITFHSFLWFTLSKAFSKSTKHMYSDCLRDRAFFREDSEAAKVIFIFIFFISTLFSFFLSFGFHYYSSFLTFSVFLSYFSFLYFQSFFEFCQLFCQFYI